MIWLSGYLVIWLFDNRGFGTLLSRLKSGHSATFISASIERSLSDPDKSGLYRNDRCGTSHFVAWHFPLSYPSSTSRLCLSTCYLLLIRTFHITTSVTEPAEVYTFYLDARPCVSSHFTAFHQALRTKKTFNIMNITNI